MLVVACLEFELATSLSQAICSRISTLFLSCHYSTTRSNVREKVPWNGGCNEHLLLKSHTSRQFSSTSSNVIVTFYLMLLADVRCYQQYSFIVSRRRFFFLILLWIQVFVDCLSMLVYVLFGLWHCFVLSVLKLNIIGCTKI